MSGAEEATPGEGAAPRICLVAGEASGDVLGAELIAALRDRYPGAAFFGVAGPRMREAGCEAIADIEALSVMGLVEVLRHLPRLLRLRRGLVGAIAARAPDVFIGIDAPDFNLGLELRLRRRGIRTVHYVSPSVWAWRQYRVKKIARAVDLMLTLLPFERDFYRYHEVPASYVGHPLADRLPLEPDRSGARRELGLPMRETVIAVLPGSRMGEVRRLGPLFLDAADLALRRRPGLRLAVPCASAAIRAELERLLAGRPLAQVTALVDGRADRVLAAADVALLASGTATLEAMLAKRPMVVAYRLQPLTYQLARWLVEVPYFALPNLLANEPLVDEFLQDQATPQNLAAALLSWLDRPAEVAALERRFTELHRTLRCDGARRAAEAVGGLLERDRDRRHEPT